ncbi:MAG: TlpA disulfide reductase family protein [Blastocatellia bacterium]
MSKVQELIIGLSFFLLSILIGGLYSSYVVQTNSLIQTETKQPHVVSGANTEYSPIKINEKVRDFSLQDENNQIRSFQELRNNKFTLVYFFAGGCGHCLQMLPKLQENKLLYRAKESGYEVIGISFYGRPQQDKVIAEKFGLPSPILADPQGAVCRSFGVGEFTIALINADNILYYREVINSSNWPSSELAENVSKLNHFKAISSELPTTGNQQKNSILIVEEPKNKTNSNKMLSLPYVLYHDFSLTILNNSENLQILYTILYPSFLLIILIVTIINLSLTKTSWLPILAMSQVALIATFYDNWLFFPTNLFFILLIVYIWKKQDFLVPIILVGSLIFLFSSMLFPDSFISISQAQWDQGLLRTLFFVIPNTVFSAVMVKMSLSNQSQSYTKYAYPVANNKDDEGFQAASTIAIRTVSKAERCDVCHKVDQFNLDTGYCLRCKTTTK